MILMRKIVFLIYLLILSYLIFNEFKCTSIEFFGLNCEWLVILGKGTFIGGIYAFIDRKFVFNLKGNNNESS